MLIDTPFKGDRTLRHAALVQYSSNQLVISFDVAQRRGDIGVIEQALGYVDVALRVTHQVCRDGVPEPVGSHADPELGDQLAIHALDLIGIHDHCAVVDGEAVNVEQLILGFHADAVGKWGASPGQISMENSR